MELTLTNLKGLTPNPVTALYFKNISEIGKGFRTHKAISSANSNGAINIWKDDNGVYNCESMRYFVRLEHKKFNSLKDVKEWAKKWLIEIA